MKRLTGGAAVVEVLKAQGVKVVFGLLGGSMLELYDALYDCDDIRYIGARDERAAGHMADAYARITGGPGVVLGAQAGPGVANLVTAVAEAQLAYSPLVAIAGAITRRDLGKDTFQEIDQISLFQPISKKSLLVTDPDRLVPMLQDAIRLAMSGRRGPVVLHVPRDLFAAQVDASMEGPVTPATGGAPPLDVVDSILDLLAVANAPVIVAGGGFKWPVNSKALIALAETSNIPVVASTGHADVMPHGHPLFAGQAGPRGNKVASRLTRDADFILVIGARLAFNSTFYSHDYVSATAKIVHIDIEASSIGRYFSATIGVHADAHASAEVLADAFQSREMSTIGWNSWIEQFKKEKSALQIERVEEGKNKIIPLHPQRALAEIREALPRDAIVTLDTGNACLQAADRLAHYQTPGLITPLDFGLVGFGYAAALGAQAAAPGRPVISIMGDGGFGYTMAEITTAVRYKLPVVAIVLDNGAWGAEKAYQKEFFNGRLLGAEIDSPAYDEVAKLCGAYGYGVEQPGELTTALIDAIAQRYPTVIHVKIDPAALNTLRKDLFVPATQGKAKHV